MPPSAHLDHQLRDGALHPQHRPQRPEYVPRLVRRGMAPLNIPAGTVATGGPGVTGTVGAATQSNGTLQVTYNGSPLYTFVSDTAPGQVTGDGVTGFSSLL